MSSKYVDLTAITQVIGCIFNKNSILDYEDKYPIIDEDFTEDFHKVVFGAIHNLHQMGSSSISLKSVHDYLSTRPKSLAVYNASKGEEYLTKASMRAEKESFDVYYSKMKKMGLLRAYDGAGVDVTFLYDPDNIFDIKKSQAQQDWLDSHTVIEIANMIDEKMETIRRVHVDNVYNDSVQAGSGIEDLISKLLEFPEAGLPMYGSLINTVTRGSRLKKFYLRSAPSGVGKSRAMVADACFIACNKIYDNQYGWIKNGNKEPAVFISTELEVEEIQTLILAFLSNVNEEHILNGDYIDDEYERILEAGRIVKDSPLYIELLPDFSMRDIEYTIKRNIREHDVRYVYLDYIHTSLKILEEISKRTGGVKLREDNILFMLSIRLKDLCNEYGVFLMSGTQLNGDWKEAKIPDQNLLRGAKAIADKIDLGCIMLPVTQTDLESLESMSDFFEMKPNMKISIYKNRRGRFKGVYLWCQADLGTCRINPVFATDYDYAPLKIDDYEYKLKEDEKYELA